jgi:hypothetical protein
VERSREALGDPRYPDLTRFLLQLPPSQDRIALNLLMVEELSGQALPLDAALPSWWENNPTVPHARSWLLAGWEVDDINPGLGVAFARATRLEFCRKGWIALRPARQMRETASPQSRPRPHSRAPQGGCPNTRGTLGCLPPGRKRFVRRSNSTT